MGAWVDTLCLLAQPNEGNNQFKNKKNNQNCQKIKLYANLTTKDLKKKQLTTWVRQAEWTWCGTVRWWQAVGTRQLKQWPTEWVVPQ